MSAELIQARQRINQLEQELGGARDEHARLNGDIETKNEEIRQLQGTASSLRVDVGSRDSEIQRLTTAKSGAEADRDAKQRRIEQIERELEEARKDDPETIARRQAEAARIARETAEADAEATAIDEKLKAAQDRKSSIKSGAINAGISAAMTLLILGGLYLFGFKFSTMVYVGVPALVAAAAFLMPSILTLLEEIGPKAAKYWRLISIVSSLALGAILASLGTGEETGWKALLLWTVTFFGYAALAHGVVEALNYMRNNKDNNDKKTLLRVMVMSIPSAIVGGIALALLNPDNGNSHPALFLVNIARSIGGLGALAGIGTLIGWFGIKMAASFAGLWERTLRGNKDVDVWLRRAKALTVVASILVGIIVGMSLWPSNGEGNSSRVVAIALGFVLMVAYFLVEGKVLESCFRRSYSMPKLLMMIVFGFVLASITGYLTFSKLYAIGSSSQRFKAEQNELITSETTYLSTVEPTCKQNAEYIDDENEKLRYTTSVKDMKAAIQIAQQANSHAELEESLKMFQDAGGKVTDALPRKQNGLLSTVKLSPEPHPTELGGQVLAKMIGKGEKTDTVYTGATIMAGGATLIVDYLIVLFAVFALMISRKLSSSAKDEAEGRVISFMEISLANGDLALECIISIGTKAGVEKGDTFNILSDEGNPVAVLQTTSPWGSNAFVCRLVGRPSQQLVEDMPVKIVS